MNSIRFKYLGFGAAVITCAAMAPACSSSEEKTPPAATGGFPGSTGAVPGTTGGTPGTTGGTTGVTGGTTGVTGGTTGVTGGTTGTTGGVPATGGVNVGGQTSASDIKIVGTVTQCVGTTPDVPPGNISACSIPGCTAAHCVPEASLAPGTDKTQLPKCPDGSYCTPDDFIATSGKFLTKTCKSLENAEGRCLSTCIPQVNSQAKTLPKDNCADSELCTPCYNPIDGTDTGACKQGCDTGPKDAPVLFDKCGGGKGICVPKAIVPTDFQSALPADTCTKTDYLCAPTEKAKDFNYQFPKCTPTSIGGVLATVPGPNGQKGGCIPKYIVPSATAGLLLQDGCQTGELCAPCTNPTSMPTANAPTGACPTQ